MEAFNPWTATLEQVERQPNKDAPQGAFQQWHAAQTLIKNKEKILSGDGFSVLQAVASCAMAGLVLPDWLAIIFLNRYRAVLHCKVDSWDAEEAFGRPYPKGTQISSLNRKRKNRLAVARAVRSAIDHNPEIIIDDGFWEQIGKNIGEGKTNAQKLHADAVRRGFAIKPSVQKAAYLDYPTNIQKLTGLHKR